MKRERSRKLIAEYIGDYDKLKREHDELKEMIDYYKQFAPGHEKKEKSKKVAHEVDITSSEGIRQLIINKIFYGNSCGPFEYNDVREVSNEIASAIQQIKCDVWDQAWKAFLKNNPKNPYREIADDKTKTIAVGVALNSISKKLIESAVITKKSES